MYKVFILILNIFFIFNFSLYADIILLRSGKQLEGKIINQTREKVQIRLENGQELILDKDQIVRIQFGPTEEEKRRQEEQKRLEEEKRRQEEQKRLEEEKRRQEEQKRLEEEKRRQEELRKIEEKRRKELEKQKIKEPLLKRREIIFSFGRGFTNTHLPLEKIESIFSRGVSMGDLFFSGTGGLNYYDISGFKRDTTNETLEFIYNVDNWSFGLTVTAFDLKALLKNLSYFELSSGVDYKKTPPVEYKNFQFSAMRSEIKINDYGIVHLWGKYTFFKFNPWNSVVFLSIPFGILTHNFDFENKYSMQNINLLNTQLDQSSPKRLNSSKIDSKNTSAIFTGIVLENQFKDKSMVRAGVYLASGEISYVKELFFIRHSDFANMIAEFYGHQTGVDIFIQYEKEIYNQISFFAKWNFNEFQSDLKKANASAFFTGSSELRFLSGLGFFFQLFQNKGKVGKIIEKNHFFNLGINFKWNL